MTAKILDGVSLAGLIHKRVKAQVDKMEKKPSLAVVMVGDNRSSKIYIKAKEKACKKAGIKFAKTELPNNISENKLLSVITKLNNDKGVDGILVQLPLLRGHDKNKVIGAIDPKKDVDALHPQTLNLKKKDIFDFEGLVAPCTAKAVIYLIKKAGGKISGSNIVVVGRSDLVGKPVALFLRKLGAKVTVCHSQTKDLKNKTKGADILIVAVGKPNLITADMVGPGAVVIDVGINRVDNKIVGDVDFENVKNIASFITPVPGGVGPVTVGCLLENILLLAHKDRHELT